MLIISSPTPHNPSVAHAQTGDSGPILAANLGVTFVSSGQEHANEARYQTALAIGAGWNRWPLYWQEIERVPGSFDWSTYDPVVLADLQHGFQINVILLSRPAFRADGDSIAGLYEPIFADGSDDPGPGKVINPRNVWADFVARAVIRYRPGGVLAQSLGWPAWQGVRVWEVWNEPDFEFFWSAGVEEYVRLLKVAYLTIHHFDPEAQVMFGGLAYTNPEDNDWFARALRVIVRDSDHRRHNFYFDLVGLHSYTYVTRADYVVEWARERLREVGANGHPIWLNESGVAVWDDYPGPTWADEPGERVLRATMNEQAAFVIQNATLAWTAGVEVVFHHQLFDDCGNQASGTDFPPHQGEMCVGGFQCWGDAYGLFRNPRQAQCFRQHPYPGTPRPAALALEVLARVFGRGLAEPIETQRVGSDLEVVQLTFYRHESQERIEVVWNRTGRPVSIRLDAPNGWATLYDISGTERVIWAEDDSYRLLLPPATNQDFPHLRDGDQYAIGGAPYILVEYDPTYLQATVVPPPAPTPLPAPISTPTLPVATQPPIASPMESTLVPTQDIERDETPPIPQMVALPADSPAVFEIAWSAEDDSGIERYVVWVRRDGAEWQPWLETIRTSSQYVGVVGHRYDFAVWALDQAGNWSTNTTLTPMTSTVIVSTP